MKRILAVTLVLIAGVGLSGCSAGSSSSPTSGNSDSSTKPEQSDNFRVLTEHDDLTSGSEIRIIEILTPEGTWLRCVEEKESAYTSAGASIDCDWDTAAEPR